MHIPRRQALRLAVGAVAFPALAPRASGAVTSTTWPDRRVRIVVPYSAGGPADVAARILSDKLGAAWGQAVVVEDRSGGSGNTGTELVARAAPDGYTLMMSVSAHVINASLYRELPFDPIRDFTAITELVSYGLVWVVHPSVEVTTLAELVALAKAKPQGVTISIGGIGAPTQLCALLFERTAGVEFLHVPYKGGGPASAAIVSGHVMAMCNSAATAIPQIKGGNLRPLAVAGAQRLPMLPDVPTVAELGYPDFEASSWIGLFAPANLPRDITAKIYADTAQVLKLPDVQEKLAVQGFGVVGSTPEAFSAFIAAEHEKWGKLVKSAGLKAD
jgi:tripartite-type tricarboxylate transporter receptor subunit TctC